MQINEEIRSAANISAVISVDVHNSVSLSANNNDLKSRNPPSQHQ